MAGKIASSAKRSVTIINASRIRNARWPMVPNAMKTMINISSTVWMAHGKKRRNPANSDAARANVFVKKMRPNAPKLG